jgi:hypothetical protein
MRRSSGKRPVFVLILSGNRLYFGQVTVTINADDPRTIRAVELAAEADYWLKGRNRRGEDVYAIPSQSTDDRYYVVTESSCDCASFRNGAAPCKHVLAVRLHAELARAQQRLPQQTRRGHLSVVT